MSNLENVSELSPIEEDTMLSNPKPPEYNRLLTAHYERYKRKVLEKVTDCSTIVSYPCLSKDYYQEICYPQTSYHPYPLTKEILESYTKGVSLLKQGSNMLGKKEIRKAARGKLPHAEYVLAIITFKEIVDYHFSSKSKLPSKSRINEAIKYMTWDRKFSPLPSFVLGIMLAYNQITIDNEYVPIHIRSARACFKDVVKDICQTKGTYSHFSPKKYFIREDENEDFLKWIIESAKYELAREMLYQGDLSEAKSLLEELSSGDFADSKFLYAIALLQNSFHDMSIFRKRNFDKAFNLLSQAVEYGHEEAMFAFGTLPFRQEFNLLDKEIRRSKGKICFDTLFTYIETCGKDGRFTKEASVIIAAEYIKVEDSYVSYIEIFAKGILRMNDCTLELKMLEKLLRERREQATTVLLVVITALKHVLTQLGKNEDQSAQELMPLVKELLHTLEGSKIYVEQCKRLSLTLQIIHLSCDKYTLFLCAPLKMLCDVLELKLNKSHLCSQNILLILRDLFKKCCAVHIKHIEGQGKIFFIDERKFVPMPSIKNEDGTRDAII